MRKTLLAVGILFIYGIGSGELLACGDKFLVASRGTRYQRAGQARETASILIYLPPSSALRIHRSGESQKRPDQKSLPGAAGSSRSHKSGGGEGSGKP